MAVLRPVLALAPIDYLDRARRRLATSGIVEAVARHRSDHLFDWIVPQLALQGVSDRAAFTYAESRPPASFAGIAADLARSPRCPRLRHHWVFHECRYRKSAASCAEPAWLSSCSLPRLDLRKGTLAIAAHALFLAIRDAFGGDLVAWLDRRLVQADPGVGQAGRAAAMRASILEPLCEIEGTGPKVWSMILADLLLAADPDRERWVTTGASFVAVDSLVHSWLHRTGVARRAGAAHLYGPTCHRPGGCADLLTALADAVSNHAIHPDWPRPFPRWVQWAIWHFCAADGWALCNGNTVPAGSRCEQRLCPAFGACDRTPLATTTIR